MEKLLLPAFQFKKFFIVVPKGVLPMDVYNDCQHNGLDVGPHYGWLTSRGRFLSPEDAAKFALENGLVDKVYKTLSITDFKGEWNDKN